MTKMNTIKQLLKRLWAIFKNPEIVGLEEDALEGDANAISLLECKYNIESDF